MFWHPFWRIFVRSLAVARPCWFPPSTWFYCYYSHLRAAEVPLGCGPQSGAVPVSIPISFRSRAAYRARGCRFSVGSALSLFIIGQLVPHRSSQIPGTVALCDTLRKYQGRWVRPGKCEVNTEQTMVLTVIADPGSIRVNSKHKYHFSIIFELQALTLETVHFFTFLKC